MAAGDPAAARTDAASGGSAPATNERTPTGPDVDPIAQQPRWIRRGQIVAALAGVDVEYAFLTAASPGVVSLFFRNEHYPTEEAYIFA